MFEVGDIVKPIGRHFYTFIDILENDGDGSFIDSFTDDNDFIGEDDEFEIVSVRRCGITCGGCTSPYMYIIKHCETDRVLDDWTCLFDTECVVECVRPLHKDIFRDFSNWWMKQKLIKVQAGIKELKVILDGR